MIKLLTKEYDDLYYLCSLIEFISRETNNTSKYIVNALGENELLYIKDIAEVLHCDSFEETAERFILEHNIALGTNDKSSLINGESMPKYTKIGKAYANLIEKICLKEENLINTLIEIYNSWITEYIEDYDSDFYYLPVDYQKCCYEENKILRY